MSYYTDLVPTYQTNAVMKWKMKSYCPDSLLFTCGKILHKIVFSITFKQLDNYRLLLVSFYWFVRASANSNNVRPLVRSIYQSERDVFFLDLSNMLDGVWEDGLTYKAKFTSFQKSCGKNCGLISSFLSEGYRKSFSQSSSIKVNES